MTSAPTTNIPVSIPAGRPTPPTPSTPRTISGSVPGARSIANRLLHGTPGRMRLLALVAVIAALALGGVCANALVGSRAAVERAANNTAQVVRAQSIHVELLRADALATNAFLVGGLESPENRAKYDASMASVATTIAEAAAAQPADGTALGALSADVQTYAALVEQARSNNRQGLPVGAQYLKQASAGLRSDAIPIVTQIVASNEQRAKDEFARAGSTTLLLVGLVSLLVLAGVAVWLARRTHRYLNVSLTGAIVLLVVAFFVAWSTISGVGASTAQVQSGNYDRAVQLATVRTAANDARSNESLTLIARGSGTAFEKAWKANDTTVTDKVRALGDDALTTAWTAYGSIHQRIRQLDDSGKWDDAVALSTDSSTNGAGGAFESFDKTVTQERDVASRDAVSELQGLGGPALLLAIAIGLASLAASWLIVRGMGQRIEEYK
ncbi:hypothetical protein N865_09350 [Intrasporangium oryzae NRRL B-24470]|uniref:Secreted protein n=1 Tax=Intrasporangium oryzae NRRL B-24470 TaxID=1386089 RepID=W9GC58_9MICO|nr:hypothetical protein [Intrasporangium oryzae]EWT03640.1 hypothetical protein N865_09350 [Intrasporangium oryzae NRRL B-24470]